VWLATKRIKVDTITANGWLRKGRIELLRSQYTAAIASLQRSSQLSPQPLMATYQLTVAYAMNGQLPEASAQLQKLFGFGSSTAYAPIATKLITIVGAQQRAEQSGDPVQRALTTFDAATYYWNFGYYNAAYSTLRSLVEENPTYFTGLLWGWHYAMQRADTVQAAKYLSSLKKIDSTNAVVRQFALIELVEDSLGRARDTLRRSTLHLEIARSYKSVDLPEDAIDEAQRALRENERNVEAWLFQARLFEEQNAPRAARWAFQRVLAIDSSNAFSKMKLSSQAQ
jgi:tetratricopeptide (TPR) repeat protein